MFRLLKGNKRIIGLMLYCLSITAIIVASIIIYNKHIDNIEYYSNIFANSNDEFDKFVYYGKLSALYNVLSAVLCGFIIAEISCLVLLKKEYIKKQIIYSFIIFIILIVNVVLQVINPLIFAPQNFYALILVIGVIFVVISIRELRIEKTIKKEK